MTTNRQFHLLPGLLFFHGPIADNTEHSHNALQLTYSPDEPFHLYSAGRSYETRLLITLPNEPHQIAPHQGPLLVILIDAQSPLAHALRKDCDRCGAAAHPAVLMAFDTEIRPILQQCNARDIAAKLDTLLRALTHTACPSGDATDPRIIRVLASLESRAIKRGTLTELAGIACLSESRFTHLFKAQVGIPLRRYLLWLRLMDAVEAILGGASMTEAAHAAEFADSAHLSRTFRRNFGLSMRMVQKSQFVQV